MARLSSSRTPTARGPARLALGHQAHGLGEQRVARQDRGVLAVELVAGGPAAPQVVVVHGGQVVVDERVGVHQLDGRGRGQQPLGRLAERPRRWPARAPAGCACRRRAASGASPRPGPPVPAISSRAREGRSPRSRGRAGSPRPCRAGARGRASGTSVSGRGIVLPATGRTPLTSARARAHDPRAGGSAPRGGARARGRTRRDRGGARRGSHLRHRRQDAARGRPPGAGPPAGSSRTRARGDRGRGGAGRAAACASATPSWSPTRRRAGPVRTARAGRENLCPRIVYLTGAFAERVRVPAAHRRAQRAPPARRGSRPSWRPRRSPWRAPSTPRAASERARATRCWCSAAACRDSSWPGSWRGADAGSTWPTRTRSGARARTGSAPSAPIRRPATRRARRGCGRRCRAGAAPTRWWRPWVVPRRGASPSALARPGGEVLLHGGCAAGSEVDSPHRAPALRRAHPARLLPPHARRGATGAGDAGGR